MVFLETRETSQPMAKEMLGKVLALSLSDMTGPS